MNNNNIDSELVSLAEVEAFIRSRFYGNFVIVQEVPCSIFSFDEIVETIKEDELTALCCGDCEDTNCFYHPEHTNPVGILEAYLNNGFVFIPKSVCRCVNTKHPGLWDDENEDNPVEQDKGAEKEFFVGEERVREILEMILSQKCAMIMSRKEWAKLIGFEGLFDLQEEKRE